MNTPYPSKTWPLCALQSKDGKEEEDDSDDDIPDLVENFDEVNA